MGNRSSSSSRPRSTAVSGALIPESDGSFLLTFGEGRLTRKHVLQALRSMQHVQRQTLSEETTMTSSSPRRTMQLKYKLEISACVLESEAVKILIGAILIGLSSDWTLKTAQVALWDYDERHPLLRFNAREQSLLLSHILQAMAQHHTNMEVLSYSTASRYTDPTGRALRHLVQRNSTTLQQLGICTPARRITDLFMVELMTGLAAGGSSRTPQYLTLLSSQLTDHEFQQLVLPALHDHNSLEALDLSQNPGLTAVSLIPLSNLLQQESSNLKALYLNHTNVLKNHHHQHSTILELDPFMDALANNTTLGSLRLHSTGMDDNVLKVLFQQILVKNNTLKRLDVSQNVHLTLDAVDILIDAVPQWKGLTLLHFGSHLQATTTRTLWDKNRQASRLCQSAFQNTSMVEWKLELQEEWDWDHVLTLLTETGLRNALWQRAQAMLDDIRIPSALWPHALDAFLHADVSRDDGNESQRGGLSDDDSYIGLEACFCVLRDKVGEWS